MKFRVLIFILTIFLINGCVRKQEVVAPSAVGPTPNESQLEWHEMETNAFVHFTTNTFTGKEWGYGDESPKIFNPSAFNADQWVSAFKEAGFKAVILTCKHHDGFCLWPSKYTEHSVKNSPFDEGNGDIVRAVSDACKRAGLKFGVYLSPWDRNRADYGTPAYIEYYRNQLKELFSSYGPIFEMWFDGANGGDGYYGGSREARKINGATYYDWPTTLNLVREMDPNVIFFSDAGPGVRWVGNERGVAGETNWNTLYADTLFAGKPGIEKLLNEGNEHGNAWIPAEVDVSIRPGWFYHPEEDAAVKTPEQLFEIYLTSVGRGSTLLLNVPPDRRGLINENDLAALKGWKEIRDREFKTNFALHALTASSSHRGNLDVFSPNNVTDGNKETYWSTDDDITTGSIDITFGAPQTIKYMVLQEFIKLGQRVESFTVDVSIGDTWKRLASGTTIGYKRILKIDPVTTTSVRVTITSSKACPLISSVEIY